MGETIKPEQVEVLNNYKEYLNWKSKKANEAIDCLKKEGVKVKDDTVVDFEKIYWDPAKELSL